ncbi:MAG: RNA 3'-terminal phosphate cyclase [Promethearchaeota archaeon]
MTERKPLIIDGSFGEGGGAILRLSAGYSVLYQRPVKIINIRANRPKPGLRLQHLLGLKTLANLTGSTLSKCDVGSVELSFTPRKNISNNIRVDVNTAASLGLLLQPVQIACLGLIGCNKIEIFLNGGGTFGRWAPSLYYLENVVYPLFKTAGLKINFIIDKYGWYPKGGARVRCMIEPPKKHVKSINFTSLGNIDLIQGEITITESLRRSKNSIAERVEKSTIRQIKKTIDLETKIKTRWVDSLSPGVAISLWARSDLGTIISSGTILGERKITSEQLGVKATNELAKYVNNNVPVDNYLSDQLIPLMCCAKSPSSIRVLEITDHARTNLEIVKIFTGREYEISKEKDGAFLINYK